MHGEQNNLYESMREAIEDGCGSGGREGHLKLSHFDFGSYSLHMDVVFEGAKNPHYKYQFLYQRSLNGPLYYVHLASTELDPRLPLELL